MGAIHPDAPFKHDHTHLIATRHPCGAVRRKPT